MHARKICWLTFTDFCCILPVFLSYTTDYFLLLMSCFQIMSFPDYTKSVSWALWHYLHFGRVLLSVFCLFFFFREYSGWFGMHSSFFFWFISDELLFLSTSWFWIFVNFLLLICDDTNPVKFQIREVKKRITFWWEN